MAAISGLRFTRARGTRLPLLDWDIDVRRIGTPERPSSDRLLDTLRHRLGGPFPIVHEDQRWSGRESGEYEPAGRRGDHRSISFRMAKDGNHGALAAATDGHGHAMRPPRMTSTAHQHAQRFLVGGHQRQLTRSGIFRGHELGSAHRARLLTSRLRAGQAQREGLDHGV